MKRASAVLATLLFIPPLCAQEVNLQDSLWQKAVALSGANEDWVPGLLVVRMEMLDGRGKAQSVEETWLKMSLGPDGKIKKDLIKQVKDGKVKDGPETKVEARSGEGKKEGRESENLHHKKQRQPVLPPGPGKRFGEAHGPTEDDPRQTLRGLRIQALHERRENVKRDRLAGGTDGDPARNPVYRPSAPGPRPAPLDPGAL